MARPTKPDGERLDVAIGMRILPEDAERLDAVCRRVPIATRHQVARTAMRLGLALLENDPTLILSAGLPDASDATEPPARTRKAGRPGRGRPK